MLVPPFVARGDARRSPTRRVLDGAEAAWRYRTAAARALPDYVVVGAGRSGTSFLARQLRRHPDVIANFTGREVHYFDRWHALGERWYRMHFPRRAALGRRARRRGRPVVTGEKTPYLPMAWVPGELRALAPDVRIVVLLREPLDRAWSLHRKFVRDGRAPAPIEELMDANLEWFDGGTPGRPPNPYAWGGWYADQLEPWRAAFGDQVLVARSEDLFTDPEPVIRGVAGFIGIDPDRVPRVGEQRSEWTSARSVTGAQRERYGRLFTAANARLADEWGISWEA